MRSGGKEEHPRQRLHTREACWWEAQAAFALSHVQGGRGAWPCTAMTPEDEATRRICSA